MLTVGSLFAGCGGFDLGLERAGMRVIWQSEIDPYASAVLKKHWPDVPNHGDIRSIQAGNVERPDVLCGGFPCQDISNAGKRAGIDGERSGLWSEYARVIGELRPRYVIVENVAALLGRGLERVLGDLAALGFDAEWHCIPASAVGAPHRRDRLWIVAYAGRNGGERWGGLGQLDGAASSRQSAEEERQRVRYAVSGCCAHVADADQQPQRRLAIAWRECNHWITEPDVGRSLDGFPLWLVRFVGWGLTHVESLRGVEALRKLWNADVSKALWRAIGGLDRFSQAQILFAFVREYAANPDQARLLMASPEAFKDFVRGVWGAAATSGAPRQSRQNEQRTREHSDALQVVSRLFAFGGEATWRAGSWEDGIPRVALGVPRRVDRLRCLGNAIVPQIAEMIGRAIVESSNA